MRFEYKYIVSKKHLEAIRGMITPYLNLDKFAEAGNSSQYTVRSIYFDSVNFDFYFEKIEGIKNRKKVRVRGYNNIEKSDRVFLEIKRKYDVPILKFRSPSSFSGVLEIFEQRQINGSVLKDPSVVKHQQNAERFFYQVFSRNLRPVNLVVYEREAYLSKFDPTVRVTLDKNLRGKSFPGLEDLGSDQDLVDVMGNFFIIEVKFNRNFPSWMIPVLAKFGLKKRSASKYVMTMDACRTVKKISKSTLYTHSKWYN